MSARPAPTEGSAGPTASHPLPLPARQPAARAAKKPVPAPAASLYTAGFDAQWELDLFGGKQRAAEAATADFEASREDLLDVLVSLLAEVARNYLEVRTSQARLAIATENLQTRTETEALTRQRLATGLASQLEVEEAVASQAQAQARIPALEESLAQAANRLAVLIGAQPGSLTATLAKPQPIPAVPQQLVIGVPAAVLHHRPDVRSAERQLAAQTARIGEATAALYPDLTLSGSIGLEAFTPGRLFSGSADNSSSHAGLSWPLFDFGAIRQNIAVQNARQEQALGNYEGTILTALEEVENSLTAYDREQRRYQALLRAEKATKNSFAIARQQYQAGLASFFTVLDSQRSLLTIQDQVATSRSTVTANLISLYKALGGGWTSFAATGEKDQQD